MKTRILLFTSFLFTFISCKGQSQIPNNVFVTKTLYSYVLNDKVVTTVSYKYVNRSKETVWLWIDKDDVSEIKDIDKQKKYFFFRESPVDMNLIQIGMDGEVSTFISAVYKTFIKRIYPQNEFVIHVITNETSDSTQQSVFQFLDKRIVVFTEEKMTVFRNDITDMSPIIFYKPDIITICKEQLTSP